VSSGDPKGCFIVVEGIDGSGSTTQAKLLADRLRGAGYVVTLTCEPTAGPVGTMLRQALTRRLGVQRRLVAANSSSDATEFDALDYRTMALLFAADRADHNDVLIRPALQAGHVVISDRYVLSSLAYQSLTAPVEARGSELLHWLKSINAQVLTPDLTLVLEVPAAVAGQRRAARGGPAELFEVDSLQQRLAAFYAEAAQHLPPPVRALDATLPVDEVAQAVFGAARELVVSLCGSGDGSILRT
jgi:dTMP kinase